jgi:ABC-type branched-subunit amino acid transport system substrate-binding protein
MHTFSTYTDFKTHALQLEEYPEIDNNNWNDPIFARYYGTITPGRVKRFLAYLGWKYQEWDSYAFEKELRTGIENRERKNLSGRQVAKLVLEKPATLYVFGDIQAHFHSLMRSLQFLLERDVIDDNLKIISPDTYIIFNGDSIDRESHSLECLHLILLLLNRNPNNVFYIRGKHEDKDYWHNFGLKRELKQRAKHMLTANSPADEIPLGDLIRRFFNTLPLALYVAEKNNPLDLIRFSHAGRNNPELKEELYDTFFTNNLDQKISYYDVNKKNKTANPASIKALVTTEEWIKEHRAHEGIGILDQDLGTTSWSIVSTPIRAYQKYYGFHYDAFVEIKVSVPITNSTITLWNNDINKPTEFTRRETYLLTNSMPLNEKTLKEAALPDIKIGATMPLNRGIAIMGQRIKRGMDIRINEENKKGGINGQHISTIVYNDDYTPFIAKQNIERLIEENNTRLIILTIGSQIFEAIVDFVKDDKITAIFPTNGSPEFRKPELTSLVNFGPSYEDEIEILMDYLFKEYGARKFLLFYQNDAYGLGLLTEAHKQLKARGISDWIDVPYTRGETNFKKQVGIIKNAQVDTIGLFSTAKATEELIRQIGIDALTNKKIFGVSYLGEVSFREFINAHGLQVMLGAVVPNPAKSNLESAVLYRKAMDNNNLPYDVFSFQAFFATSLLIDVMHRIRGPITREKIVEKLEALYDDKFEGFTLTFNPKTRSLARYVWIETGPNEDWIERKIKSTLN